MVPNKVHFMSFLMQMDSTQLKKKHWKRLKNRNTEIKIFDATK